MRTIDRKPWVPNQFVTVQGNVTRLELADHCKENAGGLRRIKEMREIAANTTLALLKMGAKVPKEPR